MYNMMHSRVNFWIGSLLLLTACAIKPPVSTQKELGLQLPPAGLGVAIALQQHLTVEHHGNPGKTDELDAALEIDNTQLQLVGLAFGQRVFSLNYDGKTLSTWRHSMLPKQVRAEDILEDIQLTLWPLDALRQALPSGWHIEESEKSGLGLQRTLMMGDNVVCLITYSTMPRWSGTVKLENFRYHYTLTIQSRDNDGMTDAVPQ